MKNDEKNFFPITTKALLDEGIFEPKHIEIIKTYSTFDSARVQFFRSTNVVNIKEYFPSDDKQLDLFM